MGTSGIPPNLNYRGVSPIAPTLNRPCVTYQHRGVGWITSGRVMIVVERVVGRSSKQVGSHLYMYEINDLLPPFGFLELLF